MARNLYLIFGFDSFRLRVSVRVTSESAKRIRISYRVRIGFGVRTSRNIDP